MQMMPPGKSQIVECKLHLTDQGHKLVLDGKNNRQEWVLTLAVSPVPKQQEKATHFLHLLSSQSGRSNLG
jgi:hypothetical protein